MKYCSKCGSLIENNADVCPECGAPVNESAPQPDAGYQQNNYQQPPYNPNYQQPYAPYNPQAQLIREIDTANTLGIVSLVCSLLGAALCSIAAIVTGIICMNKIKPYMNEKQFPNDKARSAYNLGKAGLIIAVVKIGLGILAAIAWVVFVVVFAGTAIMSEIY